MTTSATAIANSFGSNTSASAITASLVTAGSLLQTIALLPTSTTNRNWLFILLLFPVTSVLNSNGFVHFGPSSFSMMSGYGTIHPIQELVKAGNLQFE
jgi:hypothetical protein